MKRVTESIKRQARQLASWWRRMDRCYKWKWRAGNLLAVAVIIAGIIVPVAQELWQSNRYVLSSATQKLVGTTDKTLTKQLSYDPTSATYYFNQAASQASADNPLAQLKKQQAQVGTASGGKDNKSLYGLDVPTDFSKGVTYHDVNSGLGFSLVPEFKAAAAKLVNGHIVFPLSSGAQAIYTLKNNGLKEDVVMQKAAGDSLTLSYQLQLPKTLEAKVIPNGNGAIGIYGADPSLLGNISYGSDKDRSLVEKARENAPKTSLIFGLPAPVIKAVDGKIGNATARFVLQGETLQVVAENLNSIKGAFTVDPSVVVTSSSDFQTGGNNEGNIDFSTSGQITRAGLTGGSISGGWTTNSNSLQLSRYNGGYAEYGGYLYVLGGAYPAENEVEFAPINSDGTVGTWQTTTSFTTARFRTRAVAYNGYVYIIGGSDASNNYLGDVQYAPINSDGSLGSWQATTSLGTARSNFAAAVYDGYLYVMGGNSSGGLLNDVQYAPINANGTLGTWQSTSSFSDARQMFVADSYNNYLYVMGGNDGTNNLSDVQYAPINANGTLGAWQSTSSFANGRTVPGTAIYNGYIYIIAGSASGTYYSDTQYASINANGTLGAWQTTSSISTARDSVSALSYNGYLYLIGGSTGGGVSLGDIQYAQIDPAGTTGSYSTSANSFTSAREGAQTVAYNGYLYVIGGDSGSTPLTTNSVMYAAINSSNGTVGAWSNTTAFSTSYRETFGSAVAYNGFMYMAGGCKSAISSCKTGSNSLAQVLMATINANGTLGAWTPQTSLPSAKMGIGMTVYNNTLYVMGGVSSVNLFSNSIYYNSINPSTGSIGATWNTSSISLPVAMAYFGATVYGGYLYIAGGCTSGTTACSIATSATYSAPMGVDSNGNGLDLTAAFTAGSLLVNNRGMVGLAAANGYLYVVGGRTGGTYYNSEIYALINRNGTVGAWATEAQSSLSTARYGLGVSVYNGYIYVTGGYNGSTYYNDVQIASVNNGGSGSTGSWSTNSNSIINARSGFGSAVYDGYIYVLGGYDGSTYYNDVQYAALNADGTIGAWHYTHNSTDDGTSFVAGFTNARSNLGAVVNNGYIYILGGNNGATNYNDVQYAPLNANGTIGTWQTSSYTLPFSGATTATIYNGYLYALSTSGSVASPVTFSYTGAAQTYTVPSGVTSVQIETWGAQGGGPGGEGGYAKATVTTTPGESLQVNVGGAGDVNGGGGFNGGGSDTYGSQDGGGGASDVRQGGTSLTNRVVVAGGGGGGSNGGTGGGPTGGDGTNGNGGGTQTSGGSGEYAGTLGAGADDDGGEGCGGGGGYYGGGATDQADGGGGSGYVSGTNTSMSNGVQTGNGKVVITPQGGSAVVAYAPLNTDGSVGNIQSTTNFAGNISAFAAIAYNGYLYILGGNSSNAVQYAPINTNGTVGTWAFTASFNIPRSALSAVGYDGYMYILGGNNSGSALNDVQYAPINANGTLGAWQNTSSFTTGRSAMGAQVYSGYVFMMGGSSGTSYYNDVQYAPLNSIARVGSYSKLIDLGAATSVSRITYNGVVPGGDSSVTYQAAGSNGVLGSSYAADIVSGTGACVGNTTNIRYVLIKVRLDDSSGQGTGGAFPDAAGTNANLTDLTVTYNPVHPPPQIRLRAGQTLQQGNLSALDTCSTAT